ncbi:Putative Prestalk A differentiation protein A [Penicillium brasilianum]|uniref:Putative Prestalk A differentiation protein A n=1 Tax=Penicillium brasilianum TaxID=104259 RepID=A0A0F7TJ48_PENBI|nr:Putative Prestalk A differentiation protein A [Penicillium brasilianum]
MSRNLCITAVDGHTGFTIAELILKNDDFKKEIDSLIGLTLHPHSEFAKELMGLGAKIVPHKPGRVKDMAKTLRDSGADTLCLIPPAHEHKFDLTTELIEAAKKASVPNVCFISSAGCDLAERERQPRLREFIDLETRVLSCKGNPMTATGHSPVVIRAGFYAENLLLYSDQAQAEGVLSLPIGKDHKFAPIALGDVSQVAAYVLTGKGKHGFSDKHRGQLIVLTGPMLASGDELATAASQALGQEMEFEDISQAEAKRVLRSQSTSDTSELQYLLEYYSLVREGKTNYISTTAFHDITGTHPQEPNDFFKVYAQEFKIRTGSKRRKANGK